MSSLLDYLPEFLVAATFITGVLWAIDRWRWRPARLAAAAELEARTPEAERGSEAYQNARATLLREPVAMEWGGSFFPVLALVLILRSFVAEPFVIPSGSMIPTLEVGDYILVNKYSYGLRLPVLGTKVVPVGEPARGDVMVFFPPHQPNYFIKRVVGIPGDRIEYRNKRLWINGEPVPVDIVVQSPPGHPGVVVVDERLGEAAHRIHIYPQLVGEACSRRRPDGCSWVVGEGEYFMMGDNRDQSDDSRSWGMVPEENIVGRAVAIWAHKQPGLNWPTFSRNGRIQ